MRVLHILRALPLTAALALTPLIRLPAQASSQNVSANPGVGSASAAKPALKTLNLDDYSGWNRIGNTAIFQFRKDAWIGIEVTARHPYFRDDHFCWKIRRHHLDDLRVRQRFFGSLHLGQRSGEGNV